MDISGPEFVARANSLPGAGPISSLNSEVCALHTSIFLYEKEFLLVTRIIDERLKVLGISLPEGNSPVANYEPYLLTGNLLFISGQIPIIDGKPSFIGIVGENINITEANAAARQCCYSILSIARNALNGDLDKIKKAVKITGFVASTPNFTDHPKVINGASDLLVDIFKENGRHARAAVGVSSLPLNVCVEIEAIFEIK